MPLNDSLIFDLDGTLWNACSASAEGWTAGLSALGIERTITEEDIASVSGKPYKDCMTTLLPNLPESRFEEALAELNRQERKIVEAKGGQLYRHVAEGIEKLSKRYRLFIVSNCQDWYLRSFLAHSNLSQYFSDVECHGSTGKPKSENIQLVVRRNQLMTPAYIGDTESDEVAAKQANVDFAHVTYGFGKSLAKTRFDSFSELVDSFV